MTVRLATAADAAVLARHRVGMFRDMGSIEPEAESPLHLAATKYFEFAIPAAEYFAWVAVADDSRTVVASAGVQLRAMLPRPREDGHGLLLGREGIVMNVFTEQEWRRRGLARRLMSEILRWAPTVGVVRLVLHASGEGRPLYEDLGFTSTNEMRYTGPLADEGPWGGAGATSTARHSG